MQDLKQALINYHNSPYKTFYHHKGMEINNKLEEMLEKYSMEFYQANQELLGLSKELVDLASQMGYQKLHGQGFILNIQDNEITFKKDHKNFKITKTDLGLLLSQV